MAKKKKEKVQEEVQQAPATPTQVTEQELNALRAVKLDMTKLITELGNIGLAEINLEKRRDNAEAFLEQLQANEANLIKALQEKYGVVNIDLETGNLLR